MDETVPFEIVYPQCDPPLVEDAADIQHMQTMALSIDAAVQSVATPADDNWISPDAAFMTGAGPGFVFSGDELSYDSALFDNATLADPANNRFVIRQTGFYDISAMMFGVATVATTTWMSIQISVNSVTGSIRGTSYTTNIATGMTFLAQQRLNEGDDVRFIYDGQVNFDSQSTRAAICRIA